MLGVAAVALFLSTVVDTPLGAALGTMAVLVASTLLLTLDAADAVAGYLPTRYWLAFVDLFRDPIHWRDVVRGTLLQGAYVVVFLGAGWANFATKDISSGSLTLAPSALEGPDRTVRSADLGAGYGGVGDGELACHGRDHDGFWGSSPWLTTARGQTDWSVKPSAPSSSDDDGGTTMRSSVVQIETHSGPSGVSSPALSLRSRSLSGWSWRQASGQESGATSPPRPARSVPWCGEPMVTTRRARLPPPCSRTHSRATTPPAE